ncbi:MAG: inorganic diphosphatase, partial [Gammaproteobacteria bacterium]|nr:inorganic diphosphatase [Gammaproteobacteria bacterium]
NTLSEDGDPVDVLVVTPCPLISGSVIRCRPLGMLQMTDESGPDSKIIALPIKKLTDYYRNVTTIDSLPESLLSQIGHFFEHYKDLESGKWVKIEGWTGVKDAKHEILSSVERYNNAPKKPNF